MNGATTCSSLDCRLAPVEIPGVENVAQVSALVDNGGFAYALLKDGRVLSIADGSKGGFLVTQVAP